MNEKKKLFAIIGAFVACIVLAILIYVFKGPNNEYKVYYLGRSGCSFCTLYTPNINYISEKYGVDYEYIDIDVITTEKQQQYFRKFEIDPTDFGTPTTVIMKGNKVLDKIVGFVDAETLFNFYKELGLIDAKEEYVSQYQNLTFIDTDKYVEINNGSEKQVVILGQPTCSACLNAKPYLDEIAKEYNIVINYYDLNFTSQEEFDKFYNSNSFIKEKMDAEELSTPTFLIVKNGKVRDSLEGFESKTKAVEFLTKNGIIKE